MVSYLFWDPDFIACTLPFVKHPITWYGILFALGFFLGYYLLVALLKHLFSKKQATVFAEKLTMYMIVSTVIGARLGHIFFYENWVDYLMHPWMIVKTWEGGLASHGAVVGIVAGLILFYFRSRKEYPMISIPRLFDWIVIPGLIPCILIRIGNFINQEVLGTPTLAPWAVIFGHPVDGSAPMPCHPVQLYEATFYFLIFLVFLRLFSKLLSPVGRLSGLFFIVMFSFRFLVEFVKQEQSYWMSQEIVTMGQLLSIPVIVFGVALLMWGSRHSRLERN